MYRTNPEGVYCRPDPMYYLDHQLKSPIITLLKLVIPDTSVLFENGPCEETIDMYTLSQKTKDKEHRERQKEARLRRECLIRDELEQDINDAAIEKLNIKVD